MKGLAALGAAALIAAAVGLWFMTKPAVVAMEVTPLTPSSALLSFKPITDDHRFGPVPQNAK